jgi:hypothetical protein
MKNIKNYITIQVLTPVYWGYTYKIHNSRIKYMTHQDIIRELKIDMKVFFHTHNLLELKKGIDNLDLHISNTLEPNTVIFACSHAY